MNRLPLWVLNNRYPSVYDSESKTAIEQTARVYGAMQDLIDEYNKFAEATNKAIEQFEQDVKDSYCQFKTEMCNIVENYIKSIDITITDAVTYMKTNIVDTTKQVLAEGIENGDIKVAVEYNEETESLDVVITNEDLAQSVVSVIRDGTLVLE